MIRTTNRKDKGKYIKIPVIWVMVGLVILLGIFLIEGKLGDDLIKSILDNEDKIKDNIRFYDATPDFFLFITSQWIIFEIYHAGAFQLKKESDAVQCLGIGGHVPVFKFPAQSPMYNYLSAHFDYYFEKEIEGKPNKYHDGTLPDMLKRLNI